MYILGGIIFIIAFIFAFKIGSTSLTDRIIFSLVGVFMVCFLFIANYLYY